MAGSASQELYGVTFGDSTAKTTTNGYAFGPCYYNNSLNVSYVGSSVQGYLTGGGTSGDSAFDTVLTDGSCGGGATGALTLNNLTAGTTYNVMFLMADSRSGVGTRIFSVTGGGATSATQQFAYVAGTPSLGGYVMATFTATGATQSFQINSGPYGYQLDALLVVKTDSATQSLNANNVTWTTPGPDSTGSMPIGNGDIGLNVWVEPSGDLVFYIGKSDAWMDNVVLNTGLGKVGGVRVSLNPAPLSSGAPFVQTLLLDSGQMQVTEGTTTLLVWVDANQSVIHVEVTSAQKTTLTVSLNNWRPASATDVTLNLNGQNKLAWYHQNASTRDPHIANMIFGALIKGDNLVSSGTSTTALVSSTPANYQVVSIYPWTETVSSTQWLTDVTNLAATIDSTPLNTARLAHQTWWDNFWHRSWIYVRGDADAVTATRGYTLQRFIDACGGGPQAKYPIHFNGSLFVIDNPALPSGSGTIAVTADYRAWGAQYWMQNTRAMYWPRLAAGDFDMMLPLFNMYRGMLTANEAQVLQFYGSTPAPNQGTYFAETAPFYGGLPDITPGIAPSFTLQYYCPILELLTMMLDYNDYKGGDTNFQTQTLVPIAKDGMLFFQNHFTLDSTGKLLLDPDNALEAYWGVHDPAPDIDGLRAVLPRLLLLPSSVVDANTKAAWTTLYNELPPVPTGLRWGANSLLPYTYTGTVGTAMNGDNPELVGIYPYRLNGIGKPGYDLALNAWNTRRDTEMGGWEQGGPESAYLGLASEAKTQILYNFNAVDPRQRFPAFWAPVHDYPPNQAVGGNAQTALQRMIVQSDNNIVYLAPAWPAGWDCDFKLNAPNQTVVQGSIIGGKVTNKTITTPAGLTAPMVIDLSSQLPGMSLSVGMPSTGFTIVSKADTTAALKQTTPGNPNVLAVVGTDFSPDETPANVVDDNVNTKYFNLAQNGTNPKGVNNGLVITPIMGKSVVNSLLLATANDMPVRDPLTLTVEGSNDPNAAAAGGNGYSLLYSGPAGLFPSQDRLTYGLYATFPNTQAYSSYRILVSSTVGGTSADGTQFSEAVLNGTLVTPLAGTTISVPTDPVVIVKQTVYGGANTLASSTTDYPGSLPASIIDGNINTKFYFKTADGLNPPGVNSGFIVTPAKGATAVNGFQIATANDSPYRDPLSITIEGSNDPNAAAAGGNGYVLLYQGPSGLQTGLARLTWGPQINFYNTTAYKTYRVLITGTTFITGADGTQYAEVRLFAP